MEIVGYFVFGFIVGALVIVIAANMAARHVMRNRK